MAAAAVDNRPAYASDQGRFGGPVPHSSYTRWNTTEETMKTWRKPKVRELSVGTEINAYACARL